MAKIKRQVLRAGGNLLPLLAQRLAMVEAYIKSIDKLLVVIDKHHPEWMKEAFPEEAPKAE
jgi:hypothetical protein